MMVFSRIVRVCVLAALCSPLSGVVADTVAASAQPTPPPGVELTEAGRREVARVAGQAGENATGAVEAPATPPAPTLPDATRFLFAADPSNFSLRAYEAVVPGLFASFEEKTQRTIKPGEKGKVGLKIYTSSGPGIATPKNLTRAVIRELERRGFKRENILLVDLQEKRIRESGYLPRLREADENFEGCPVLSLDSEKYYKPQWYYEHQLPSKEIFARQGDFAAALNLDDRKSFLPAPLMFDVDFWINLPVAMDSPALGVSGALGNATIWNISNQRRFLDSPSNADKAAVEIAAIPELKEKLLFHVMSLERYQYVGGPTFDANYCISEKRLWLSANPLILDFLLLQRMNTARGRQGFPLIEPEPLMFVRGNTPPILLGSCRPADLELVRVEAKKTEP